MLCARTSPILWKCQFTYSERIDYHPILVCVFCFSQTDKDHLINDAAAIAESIQPKGNTLSSTNVVTPVPFLLRHTLREYQVNDPLDLKVKWIVNELPLMIPTFTKHLILRLCSLFLWTFSTLWMNPYEAFVWLPTKIATILFWFDLCKNSDKKSYNVS